MSFRDLRNLSEILRNIHFPRLISLENFRTPNFKLVAEICLWLIKQLDPDVDAGQHNFETEAGRVKFVTYFAEFALKNVQVKLNTKRLYQADGYAVKELIKVATGLDHGKSDPFNVSPKILKARAQEEEELANLNVGTNFEEIKRARALGIKITQRGGALYDLLSKEITLREARYRALSKAFELDEVQRILGTAIKSGGSELSKSETMLENVVTNMGTIQAKIEKKQQELERSQKRLVTLKKVKPAFMDEYEKLQSELEKAYREYVVRFRVLSALHNQVTEMERMESERKAEERLIKQELASADDLLLYHHRAVKSNFSPGAAGNSYDDEDDSDEDGDGEGGSEENSIQYNAREFMLSRGGSLSRMRRPQDLRASASAKKANGPVPLKTGLVNGGANGKSVRKSAVGNTKPKMYGNLMNGDDDDEETESDVLLLDDDNLDQSELLSDGIDDDDDDDIDNELMEMGSDISGRAVLANAKQASAAQKSSTARNSKPPPTANGGIKNTTYRKDSQASAANANIKGHAPSSTRRGSNAKVIAPVPAAPSSSTVTIYTDDMSKYQNQVFDDQDLVVPNGMISQRPPRKSSSHFQQEISFINDEVDGFGDSSLTKPLEAPKPTTAINSVTYRKSSKAKSSSRGGRGHKSSGDPMMANGNGDIQHVFDGGYGNGDINDALDNRKKSSATGGHGHVKSSRSHHRSETGSSSNNSRSSAASRPESKSKSSRQHNNGQSASYFVNQHSVVEEEHEDLEYQQYQAPTRGDRPPSRPGSHYARKHDDAVN